MKSNIKLLKTYNQFHLAKLDEASLLNDDIQVILRDGNTVSIAPYYSVAIGGIKLYVFEEDFERAVKVLNPLQNEVSLEYFEEENDFIKFNC